jgi:dihydrofolate reductase
MNCEKNNMIIAVDANNGISKDGKIAWNIPEDMKFFKETTANNAVVMGTNTYFSLPPKNRPLKNRFNVVLTRNPEKYSSTIAGDNLIFSKDLATTDVEKSLECYDKIFIIGGKQMYEFFISYCNTIWITRINKDYGCDLVCNAFDKNELVKKYNCEIIKETEEYQIEKWTIKLI